MTVIDIYSTGIDNYPIPSNLPGSQPNFQSVAGFAFVFIAITASDEIDRVLGARTFQVMYILTCVVEILSVLFGSSKALG